MSDVTVLLTSFRCRRSSNNVASDEDRALPDLRVLLGHQRAKGDMRTPNRALITAGLLSTAVLTLSACSGSDGDTPVSSSSAKPSPSTPSSSVTTSRATTTPNDAEQNAPATTTRPQSQHQNTTTPARDDDPGGHACTDQSGAPGKYVWDNTGNQWICEITGDAPRVTTTTKSPVRDDDPGGHACTDQSGATGTYIWAESTQQWVCQIG
ncbi:hypothetical protein GYA93_01185 [Gordonia desulfuricans]|uniref:Uncharacterized protein n=1 Tax=Gordonia desulfuricans TaxID=89051 RepID=A0A7K3LIW2_9ACTN|nr:hypothetical protein [Gordonia desulfuricans]NDK88202.1 hypothetical protein [Gordonia desulfuricans]